MNISARDAISRQLVTDVQTALASGQVAAHRVMLELTEHAVVQDLPRAVEVLSDLRQLGVEISLDDFGTGYSSLFYLRELPLSEVKIDRVFVDRIEHSADDAAIVRAVVTLARHVGLRVVAEGVETPGQARLLSGLGCEYAQGYFFGRPTPFADVRPVSAQWGTDDHPRRPPRRTGHLISGATRATIRDLLTEGASLHTIAAALNRSGVRTWQHTRWSAATVSQAFADLDTPSQ